MADTIITVQGAFSAWFPAERATVSAVAQYDAPARDAVFASATTTAESLRSSLAALHDPTTGPVTWWSSDNIRVWSDRPWTQDGSIADLVHHASIGVSAKFSDFDELARWIELASALEGVSIASIDWQLTEVTRSAATTEVRSRSVKDAVTKATVFAQSIGLASVTAVALADPGMLGDRGAAPADPPVFRAMKADAAAGGPGGGQLALKPELIEVSSVVDARFVAQ